MIFCVERKAIFSCLIHKILWTEMFYTVCTVLFLHTWKKTNKSIHKILCRKLLKVVLQKKNTCLLYKTHETRYAIASLSHILWSWTAVPVTALTERLSSKHNIILAWQNRDLWSVYTLPSCVHNLARVHHSSAISEFIWLSIANSGHIQLQ